MENHGYDQVWNVPSAPYIASLGKQFAYAADQHASIHPSLPNYLEMVGASNFGITTDCSPSGSCHVSATSIADSIEAKGLTWKAYMESMPAPCTTTNSGSYAVRHNPFVYFDNIRNNPTRCSAHDVPYTALAADLASASTTPNYSFISPDTCNDMHDCAVATGDTWLKNNVPAILGSPACTLDKCLVVVTWDEDDKKGDNHILTIFAGSLAKTGGVSSAVAYSHYSVLRTVEDLLGLPSQGSNDAEATPMSDMLR
jgi:acid phosphatase